MATAVRLRWAMVLACGLMAVATSAAQAPLSLPHFGTRFGSGLIFTFALVLPPAAAVAAVGGPGLDISRGTDRPRASVVGSSVCTPVVKWTWDGPTESPAAPEVCQPPLVLQLTDDDGDGRAT